MMQFEFQDFIKEHKYIVVIKINDVSKLNYLPFNLRVSLSAYKYPSDQGVVMRGNCYNQKNLNNLGSDVDFKNR